MDTKNFLNEVCKEIKYQPARKPIAEELKMHIQDIKEDYVSSGMPEKEAEEKAVSQMGVAEEIGKKLNKIHRPKLDWQLLILVIILIGFGVVVSILKKSIMNYNYIGNIIVYMLIGIVLGICIYFFDYRKMRKYTNIIYLIATIIMFLPIIGLDTLINGVKWVRIFGITFMPCTIAVPLYLISFIGFIVDYKNDNIIKIQNEQFNISLNKDFIKILVLGIFSLISMLYIPSVANAIILGCAYLVITTVKILQNKEHKIKKIIILYAPILTFAVVFVTTIIFTSPYRLNRIKASFFPETDPNGSGYVGMLQKEVLENAKFIGQADTRVISSDEYVISRESNYTFIYLLGKTGILFSGILVLTIILTSIKLILNAKHIKEQYGKFLIIGLSTLYIFQSIASVLMNINMGIATNINLPFVTYGGVYFIVNMINIAIIFSVYRRKNINLFESETII